jgi:hypothetical protein
LASNWEVYMTRRNDDDRGTFERTGEQLGGDAGRAFGRGTDMAAGMLGSLLGSAMSSLGEWWTSPEAQRAAQSFDQSRDHSCRDHFESSSMSAEREYHDVRPHYQFGHMAQQNPQYRGRAFEDVEPELRSAWQAGSGESQTDWPEVRGYVGFGYSQENRDV